jgi:uroporphyrinogen decarboxylase
MSQIERPKDAKPRILEKSTIEGCDVEEGEHAKPIVGALRGELQRVPPIWLMRQAGRFLPEYRQIRSQVGFLDLCKNPQLAAEVTVMAVEQLGVDAAIIFADLLLTLEPLGVGLEYGRGDGPIIHRPVRTAEQVAGLPDYDVASELAYVRQSVSIARAAL